MLSLLLGWALLDTPGYVTRELEGWTLHIKEEMAAQPATTTALELLEKQLSEVHRVRGRLG
jgi:hypothetical protein